MAVEHYRLRVSEGLVPERALSHDEIIRKCQYYLLGHRFAHHYTVQASADLFSLKHGY